MSDKGEGLYENVKLELERCVGSLARELLQDSQDGVQWLISFIESCAWFEKQAVSSMFIIRVGARAYEY